MSITNKCLSALSGLAILTAAPVLWAQDTTTGAGEPIEEITVMGIRSSLRDAIGIKRSYVGTMEAISAEDFGKFPDGNLAESLARVPGIGIDRSNVEGQKIAVRGFGPEFNLVTLNGRQMPTAPEVWVGGRSFNFGDIASPGIAAVEVFKSANSILPSGGIGATVNMVTTKPLNVEGTKKSFSLGLVEDTSATTSGTPIETALLLATNQGRWGVSLSAAFQERDNREIGTRESNWHAVNAWAAENGYNRVTCCWSNDGADIVNNSQRDDGETFFGDNGRYLVSDNNRERINAQLTFQVDLTDTLRATADYTYSNVEFSTRGVIFGPWAGGWNTVSGVVNEHGAYTDYVVRESRYNHELNWLDTENENKSIGLNLDWQVNDSLSLQFDAHSSSAAVFGGDNNTNRANAIEITTPSVLGQAAITNGGNSGVSSFLYDVEFNPSDYAASSMTLRDGFKENEMEQVQLGGVWENPNDGLVATVSFGISRVENDFVKRRTEDSYDASLNTPDQYDDSLFQRTPLGNFLDGFSPSIGTDYYYHVNHDDALTAIMAANPGFGDSANASNTIRTNDRVFETLDSVYLQVDMDTEIGSMPLDIVAGLRYEKGETESISYQPVATTLRWDMINGLIGVDDGTGAIDLPRYGESDEFLPSIAFALGITDEQVVRFSASRTMARPDLFALSAHQTVGNRDFFTPTVDAGNPDLDPLTSTNFDVAYENYYGSESYVAVNYFYKDIDNFIGSRTERGVEFNGLTNPAATALGQYAIECVQQWVADGRPEPLFPGVDGATGHCVSQQAIWAQGWMNEFHHMGWVALGMSYGLDVSNGYPNLDPGLSWAPTPAVIPPECSADLGWWRCNPGYIDGMPGDPVALFDYTAPYNMESGSVSGIEVAWQHVFENGFGAQFNYTWVSGGDVEVDRYQVGRQFLLPGFGDSGNFSVFFENEKHTARLALNYRGETVVGFGDYDTPLWVDEREQIDFSYQYRYNDATTFFLDAMNINDETTRLHARYPEMLFLSQQHGPVFKFGARMNF
jgi:TonB-dependent receptor